MNIAAEKHLLVRMQDEGNLRIAFGVKGAILKRQFSDVFNSKSKFNPIQRVVQSDKIDKRRQISRATVVCLSVLI